MWRVRTCVRARGYVRVRGRTLLKGCECSCSGGIVEKADCMKRSTKRVTLVSEVGYRTHGKERKWLRITTTEQKQQKNISRKHHQCMTAILKNHILLFLHSQLPETAGLRLDHNIMMAQLRGGSICDNLRE